MGNDLGGKSCRHGTTGGLRLAVAPAWPAEPIGVAQPGHAANAGTNTSGAGGLYPIEA
jgi:hypothetical protein